MRCTRQPYEFYVTPADKHASRVYFQGGGGCWNERNCGLIVSRPSMRSSTTPIVHGSKHATGVFDLGRCAQSAQDYTIVFAPYCTADVHLGVRTGSFRIRRRQAPRHPLSGPRQRAARHGLGRANYPQAQVSLSAAAAPARFPRRSSRRNWRGAIRVDASYSSATGQAGIALRASRDCLHRMGRRRRR